MMYESEILTIYKAENGFVVKCKQPPAKEGSSKEPVKYKPDEMNVYQTIAQVIKKIKEELAPGDVEKDKSEGGDKEYKAAFSEASKKK